MSFKIQNPVNQVIAARDTHKYNPGWSHLDKWTELGDCAAIASTKAKGGDDYWTQTYAVQVAIWPEYADKVTDEQISSALDDTFSVSRCRHEHDCCGCVSSTVIGWPRKVLGRDNLWAVRVASSRNI